MSPSTPNPYEPPGAPEGVPGGTRTIRGDASRWSRLWAALIDGMLVFPIVTAVPWLLSYYIEDLHIEPFEFGLIVKLSKPGIWLVLNCFFLLSSAQTIGKKALGIQVVNVSDGEPASFLRLVSLRFLPMVLVAQVPYVGYLALIDPVFIFRGDRRCLHDHIARTRVVTLVRGP
jgi:uncharacterized RDD family membrane protein YckC